MDEKYVEQDIYKTVHALVKAAIDCTRQGTSDLDELIFAMAKSNGCREVPKERLRNFFHPVYWNMVLGKDALIDHIQPKRPGEASVWRLKQGVLSNEETVDTISESIINVYGSLLKTRYMDVHTIDEFYKALDRH